MIFMNWLRMQASPTSSETNTNSHYLVLPKAMYAHRGQTSAPEPEPEPPLDPYRPSSYQWDLEEIASQWYPDDTPQYTGESSGGPWF